MTVSIDLTDTVALVTGSSRGIGWAMAKKLASANANVVLNSRTDSELLQERRAELEATYGVRCMAIGADVSDAQAVKGLYQQVFSEYKRLDVLVNNAGILKDNLIGMIPGEDIESTLATNVVGTLNTIQAGVRLLQRGGGGSIINVASIIGVHGNKGQLVYGASKGGVITATKSAAKELAPHNIRVNAIAPGYIDTDMIRSIPPEIHEERLASIAMGRIGKPEEVADAALFLASPLSAYVTGCVIGVDGGMLV